LIHCLTISRPERQYMRIFDALFGRPLATEEEKAERIGPLKGIPIFGLDALSSAAYGPEAALTLLIPLGMAGAVYIWPITIGIVVLLAIVYFSYRQTISAYPQGGGSYTVASENLGEKVGLLAAAALMIDYVLTAWAHWFPPCHRYRAGRSSYVSRFWSSSPSSICAEYKRPAGYFFCPPISLLPACWAS
jgi:hypothetical protein